MSGLLLALAIIVVSGLVHVIAWRLVPTVRSTRVLVLCYMLGLAAGLSVRAVAPGITWAESFRAFLVSGAVFMVYLSMYMAVEKDSASSIFLLAVGRAGRDGVPLEDLRGLLNDHEMIEARLHDLADAGFVVREGGGFRLSGRGAFFLRLVTAARKAFTDRPVGG